MSIYGEKTERHRMKKTGNAAKNNVSGCAEQDSVDSGSDHPKPFCFMAVFAFVVLDAECHMEGQMAWC